MKKVHLFFPLILGFLCFTGCGRSTSRNNDPLSTQNLNSLPFPLTFNSQPGAIFGAPSEGPRAFSTDAMVFTGDGTWGTEINSLEGILANHHATYQEINSEQLESLSLSDLAQFGVLIFPGGQGATQAKSVSADTHDRLRKAIQQEGVGYLGLCAGAFIAVAPTPPVGQDVSYGFGIVNGPVPDYYFLEDQGIDISMTLHSFPDGTTQDILWYGGPVTPDGPGVVIAKYPNGNPAISQIWAGKGLVLLSGGHPTASQATLAALGVTSSDGIHQELAWKLVNAAIQGHPLLAF